MYFASDNWAGAHPAISAALTEHGSGFHAAYGTGPLDREAERRLAEIFEHEVSVWFLPTGTAANSLALAAVNRIGGVAFAHADAHVREDEGGAPEFLTGGVRVRPVPGSSGKIDASRLREEIEPFSPGTVNMGRAMAVSITQATEIGTVYGLEDITAISGVCRDHGLPLHMDGARFANALVSLDCSPAEMTWKSGVDILSFGGTKNGCWCAEALLFFDPEMARDMPWLRKRSGQLFSKSRFVAAQFLAYLENGLWLELARHANAMAARLAATIENSNRARLAWPPQANEVFAILPVGEYDRLLAAGVHFHDWPEPAGENTGLAEGETLVRMVTSFETKETDIARFSELLDA
ncbi:threonine aldolase family protein [Oricola thermophila]|uniref:L-threonine aldolase n=1 Tax=Oricola thermophila TaxID=2742145 RepID=A0A6N1VKQ3_9HYPH|nr:low specificity L-threonine aldolase [Oricola thermophila]QKV20365.1 low specificity L-threonine aldolase [Oricola thermophila]